MYPPWGPGCGRGADPGLCEAFTGMLRCLSAMLEVLLCPVFASFSPMAIFYINLVLQIKNSHWVKLEMTIRFVFFFPVIDLLV